MKVRSDRNYGVTSCHEDCWGNCEFAIIERIPGDSYGIHCSTIEVDGVRWFARRDDAEQALEKLITGNATASY